MKKKSDLSRLLDYAGPYRYLTIASWVISAISALTALLPYIYIWRIIKGVLDVAPDFSQAQNLAHNGWMAVLFAVLSMLIYVGGLLLVPSFVSLATLFYVVTEKAPLRSCRCSAFTQKTVAASRAKALQARLFNALSRFGLFASLCFARSGLLRFLRRQMPTTPSFFAFCLHDWLAHFCC